MQKDFHNQRFQSIQALRGIAAIFVILEHVRFLNCGAFGVDIFFCISGFMVMYSTHQPKKGFLRKRFVRIVPLYALVTLGAFFLLLAFPNMFEQTRADLLFLIKSLLFIPFDIGNGVLQPLVRIGWTVNCEVFFYLLFAFSMKLSHKYRALFSSIWIVLLVAIGAIFPTEFAPLKFYSDPIMLEFLLGMGAYYICSFLYQCNELRRFSGWLTGGAAALSIALFAILVVTKQQINILGFHRPLYWGVAGMLIVLCFFIVGLRVSFAKPLVYLGNISFSIYLVHYYPLQFLDRKIVDFSVFSFQAVIGVLFGIALCIILATVCYRLIENRFKTRFSR